MVNEDEQPIEGYKLNPWNPGYTHWVGPLSKEQLSDWGKFITFGPAPPGLPSLIEAMALIGGLRTLSKTPQGIQVIKAIAIKYLDTVGKVLESLHHSSASNFYTAMVNEYVACTMYQRMGLMSPHDAVQSRAWIDHQIANILEKEYIFQGLGSITTLVTGTNESRSYTTSPSGSTQETEKGSSIAALHDLVGLMKAGAKSE